MNTEDFKRKLTAILSADVQGYSRLMGEDEDSTVRTLTAYRSLMSGLIQRYRGRVVDSPGDNLLAEFGSVMDVVRCAVEIQEELRIRNEDQPENRKMQFRIGINLGDVIEEGDRIYGDGINVAARVEGLSEGGGICISGTVYDSIRNKLSMSYDFLGEHNVKNIKEPVRIYRIRMEPEAASAIVEEKKARLMTWQRAALSVVIIFILIAVAIWYFFIRQTSVLFDGKEGPKTIAVLPFADMSPEKDQEYFVDGLSEELLNNLAQLPGLNVAGRTSSFAFKGSSKTAKEIAKVLGVESILEGSVRKAGTTLRITVQLLRASDGFHLWSETFNRELKDIFKVQEDISKAVAEKLKVTFGIGSLKQIGGTDNPGAYELYLTAKGQFKNFKKDHGLGFVDAALLLDPEFALAHALKAQIQNHLSTLPSVSDNQVVHVLEISLKEAQKAVKLEPKLAEGHFAVGIINTAKGKWIEAELAFQEALELSTDPLSRNELQYPYHYMCVGRIEKARQILETQIKTDPVNIRHHSNYIRTFLIHGDMKRALEQNEVARGLLGDVWQGNGLIISLRLASGKSEDKKDDPSSAFRMDNIIGEYFISEGLAEIRKLYKEEDDRLTVSRLYNGALWAARSGDPEFAMELIKKAGIQRADNLENLWYPVYHEVRKLPLFKEFIKDIGLVDYWDRFGWSDFCRPVGNADFECD